MNDLTPEFAKQFSASIEKKLTDHKEELAAFKAMLADIEQKSMRTGSGRDHEPSIGEQFVRAKAADLAQVSQNHGRTSMSVKASLTSSTANAAGAMGALFGPETDGPVALPRRRLTIRQLLNVVPVTNANSVEYPRQVSRNNNAAPVAEGAAKPESDMQFELVNLPIRTIAHWTKASRQLLDDAPQMQALIDGELRYGLAIAEETQLLNGSGSGQNLNGMMTQATAYAAPITIDDAENRIDRIGLAILQAALTDVTPDGIVIHPSDWWAMRLLKDGDGKYILGDPQSPVAPSLFGLPVVPTQAMAVDHFLVGAFGEQTLYDRWEARVEVGFVNDDFTKNMVTILAEERVGLAVKRANALIEGTFTD